VKTLFLAFIIQSRDRVARVFVPLSQHADLRVIAISFQG
jgi:hypothetical protein